MLCQCGERKATVHITEIVDGKIYETHLCHECDKKHKSSVDPQKILSQLTQNDLLLTKKKTIVKTKCPDCGTTSEQISKSGKLGCPSCYQNFSKELLPLIKRIQNSLKHTGKGIEHTSSGEKTNWHELRTLQEKMELYIQDERFEEAAKIRDKIKKLEKKK